jgi:hypothetical protein
LPDVKETPARKVLPALTALMALMALMGLMALMALMALMDLRERESVEARLMSPTRQRLPDAATVAALAEAGDVLVAEITGVTMASPPVMEFSLSTPSGGVVVGAESAGRFLFTLAKLVPAADGVPAYWQSYTNRWKRLTMQLAFPRSLMLPFRPTWTLAARWRPATSRVPMSTPTERTRPM